MLYYITDRMQLAADEPQRRARLLERVEQAARAGVDCIQLRERDLSARELEQLAGEVMEAVRRAHKQAGARTRVLINSRCDVAIACGADGVHLRSGQREMGAADARAILVKAGLKTPLVAVSCHTKEEVERAAAEGADFAVLGPVFSQGPDAAGEHARPAGLDALRAACRAAAGAMPVLALGAVTTENAAECLRAGAAGVAGIRLFQQGDVAATVAKLRRVRALRTDA